MKGTREINSELNRVLGVELIAINQYFLHARMLKNWGYEILGDREYRSSISAMKEADELIERVLFLEGLPNLQDLGRLQIGETVPEILKSDLSLETSLRESILQATVLCEKQSDFVSREALAEILESSEERIDFLEMQLELIPKMGLENYLQSAKGQ